MIGGKGYADFHEIYVGLAAPWGLRLGERRRRAKGRTRHGRHAVEAHLWKHVCIMHNTRQNPEQPSRSLRSLQRVRATANLL